MLPTIEQKLINNTAFKQLVLSAMSRLVKTELDRLTVNAEPANVAEQKLLTYLRGIMRNGGIQDATNPSFAKMNHVVAILTMFDDTDVDTIAYTLDAQGAIEVDWDKSKAIIIQKITDNKYLFGLAACDKTDWETAV